MDRSNKNWFPHLLCAWNWASSFKHINVIDYYNSYIKAKIQVLLRETEEEREGKMSIHSLIHSIF